MKNIFRKYSSTTLGGLLLSLAGGLAIFFFIGITYFYVYLPSSTNHGESITVPNVEGMNISELEKFLVDRDLRYEINDSSYSSEYPARTILKQYPHAGTKVKENRCVYLSINSVTPPTVPIPNLIDGSLINAEAVLKGYELKRGSITYVPGPFLSVVKEMHVNGIKVEPGTRVQKGSKIDLIVEDGGNTEIPSPSLLGMPLDEAEAMVFALHLQLGIIHVVGDTTNSMSVVVLKQNPSAETKMRAGDGIEIWIGEEGSIIPDLEPIETIDN